MNLDFVLQRSGSINASQRCLTACIVPATAHKSFMQLLIILNFLTSCDADFFASSAFILHNPERADELLDDTESAGGDQGAVAC